jgi:hypothetical protein
LLRSEKKFRTTQELEYLFVLLREARKCFPELNIRLYDKNSESDFFFPLPKSEYFFSNIGNENIVLEKNHSPPWKCLQFRNIVSYELHGELETHVFAHLGFQFKLIILKVGSIEE